MDDKKDDRRSVAAGFAGSSSSVSAGTGFMGALGSMSIAPTPRPLGISILDVPISKGKAQVSLSAFAYLLSEIVQAAEKTSADYDSYAARIASHGRHVGERMLELLSNRESNNRRENDPSAALNPFVTKVLWKALFGKQVDQLMHNADGYIIFDSDPLANTFVSPPKKSPVNVSIFTGGIIEGVLGASGFPATVSVKFNKDGQTVYFIAFQDKKA